MGLGQILFPVGRTRWGGAFVFAALLTLCLPVDGVTQTEPSVPGTATPGKWQSNGSRYRSIVAQLAEVEIEILKLKRSEAESAFEALRSTLAELEVKRKRLAELERQWKLLSNGTPALEIEPGLNLSHPAERHLLIELEGTKDKVLGLKAELLKLNSEFGPRHPAIEAANRKLSELKSSVADQSELLEKMGVDVQSTVATQKLQKALLRRVELTTKLGPGHPDVTRIESEIGMLEAEVDELPVAFFSHPAPSNDLVQANLELREAETNLGVGHPELIVLKKKIEVLKNLAQSGLASNTQDNKRELARRLELRIVTLQNRIFEEEAKIDSLDEKITEFERHRDRTQALLKRRSELAAEMIRLAPEKKAAKLSDEERLAVKKALADGIEALEFLGKPDEADRLRKILVELNNQK